MSRATVTITRRGVRYVLAFSALPGRTFGPWGLAETIRDLTVSALLSPREARDLVFQAAAGEIAQREISG